MNRFLVFFIGVLCGMICLVLYHKFYSVNYTTVQKELAELQKSNIENRDSIGNKALLAQLLTSIEAEASSNENRKLTEASIDRIAALSLSFFPEEIQHWNEDSSQSQIFIAERGIMLFSLANMNLHRESFKSILAKTSFEAADLSSQNLAGLNLEGAQLARSNFENCLLDSIKLNRANLKAAQFSNSSLKMAEFNNAQLNKANFSWANLISSTFRKANLNGATMESANLISANLTDASIEWANFRNANLESATLEKADIFATDLSGSILKKTNLKNTEMRRVNLSQAKLFKTNLSGAKLDKVGIHSDQWFENIKEQQVIPADTIIQIYKIADPFIPNSNYSIRSK